MEQKLNPGNYRIELVITYHEPDPYNPRDPIVSLIHKDERFSEGIFVPTAIDEMKHEANIAVMEDMTADSQDTKQSLFEDRMDDAASSAYYKEKYGEDV